MTPSPPNAPGLPENGLPAHSGGVLTYRQACEFIADTKYLIRSDGTHPTWREILEYSPSGELSAITEWYHFAKSHQYAVRVLFLRMLLARPA